MCSRRFASCLLLLTLVSSFAWSQQVVNAAPRVRITSRIDEQRTVTLSGNVHPLARAKYDKGALSDSTPVRRMLLVLSRSPEQETALKQLLDNQQTPGSPRYRQWLTPEQFGATYGPADADVQTVTSWLSTEGFQVNQVSEGKTVVEFSGTVAQVRQAFHTQMHRYAVNGAVRYANASDPQIPAALAPVVKGIASLNNFDRKPLSHNLGVFSQDPKTGALTPEYTVSNSNGPFYAIGPADFATIYNTQTLRTAGVDGRGQTIAIVGDSNINLQDITDFRNFFGLGAGNTSVVLDGSDPGIQKDGAEFEAALDTEWANAVAPGASVVLVVAQDTETTLGTDLAALHVIENNLAGVLSVSFGVCEASLGATENQLIRSLWQQAAAQGITVVVSTGDNGSAGCDDFNSATTAQHGLAVNGLASTPYNVAAGGTDFDDANASLYWNSTNAPTTRQSAKAYIPEKTWNESCAATATVGNLAVCPAVPSSGTPTASLNILAGSGGASSCSTGSAASGTCQGTPKPAWQSGRGVPNDGVRDLPDIALYSAVGPNTNSGYVVCEADQLNGSPSCQAGGNINFLTVGGTSVAAPTFAAIVTLAAQKAGTRLGNINYLLYSLAAQSGVSCTSSSSTAAGCIFNDVVNGNISVPCAAGTPNCSITSGSSTGVIVDANGNPAYPAQSGYDLATGLGSVNGANLVNAIANAVAGYKPSSTSLILNGATTQVTAKHGDPISVGVTINPTASTGSVALLGAAGGIDQNTLSGGMANWSSRMFPGGSYNVTAHYAGDGTRAASDSNGVPVSISPENSQTFIDLVTFDSSGGSTYGATTAAYGSPYILRMDVGDSAATLSSTQGVSSTCSNHIASCATGKLTVTSNGAPLDGGTFGLNSEGSAIDWTIQLSPGTYAMNASYPGDASYNASSGSTSVTITKAVTTITTGINGNGPFTYGTLTPIFGNVATTSNGVAPTGSVAFFDNGTQISPCCTLNQGSASSSGSNAYLNVSAQAGFVPVGSHSLTAQYAGDSNYSASTSDPFTFTVVRATPSVRDGRVGPNPSTPIVPVTMSVTFVGTASPPTGTVSFTDNGTTVPCNVQYGTVNGNLLNAVVTCTLTQLGTHNIVATYSGDANYTSTTYNFAPLTMENKIASSVQIQYVSLNPSLVNYPTHFIAYVSSATYLGGLPSMTGTVSFLDNGTPIGTPSVSSTNNGLQATLDYSFPTTGTHNIVIQYNGDTVFATSQSMPISLAVNDKLTSQFGNIFGGGRAVVQQTAYVAAIVSGVPGGPPITGTFTFSDNGTPLNGPVNMSDLGSSIEGTLAYTFTTTGVHNITAQYNGDANYSPATSSQPYALTVEGPLWLGFPGTNQTTIASSGGTSAFTVSLDNNTTSTANVSVSCVPDSPNASCAATTPVFTVPANSTNYPSFTITVPANTSSMRKPSFWTRASGLLLCGVFIGVGLFPTRRRKLALLLMLIAVAVCLFGCGGGGSSFVATGGAGSTGGGSTHHSITYNFKVTATDSNGNTASQVFTATVQ